uniref:Uncharacterized protein n=1 Tax=Oryza glumipatula TaxID=40148 RepID=A0A0D9ZIM0_9ORYZ
MSHQIAKSNGATIPTPNSSAHPHASGDSARIHRIHRRRPSPSSPTASPTQRRHRRRSPTTPPTSAPPSPSLPHHAVDPSAAIADLLHRVAHRRPPPPRRPRRIPLPILSLSHPSPRQYAAAVFFPTLPHSRASPPQIDRCSSAVVASVLCQDSRHRRHLPAVLLLAATDPRRTKPSRRQGAADAFRVEFNFRILLPASGLLNIRSVFQLSTTGSVREGRRRVRRSTARRNKLTRNRRQGLCMMRAARRATQFARMGWRYELQGCELWKNG